MWYIWCLDARPMKKNSKLIRSVGIFSAMTVLSRILGLVRDILIALLFGASAMVDAFFVAFKIPSMFRKILAEGAFTQAFIPIFAQQQQQAPEKLRQFVGKVMGTLMSAAVTATVFGMIFAPFIIMLLAPGFAQGNGAERYDLAIDLLRIAFPYIIFASIAALFGSILNSYSYYGPAAISPVCLNLAMIFAILVLTKLFVAPVIGLAWGVILAGICQVVFLFWFMRSINMTPMPTVAWRDNGVLQIIKSMLPALLGASITQINFIIDTVFASFLPPGSLSWLYYSDRLLNFPLGVFGVALSTVIFPRLSRSVIKGYYQDYSEVFDWSARMVFYLGLPAAIGLIVLAEPLVMTLFYRGSFNLHDTIMTSRSLQSFAVGLPAVMLIKNLSVAYYAEKDYKTPAKIGVVVLLTNTLLNAILIHYWQHAGLALATSIASYVNVILLWLGLTKKNIYFTQYPWAMFFIRNLPALVLSTMVLAYLNPSLSQWVDYSIWERIIRLLGLIGLTICNYFLLLILCGNKKVDFIGPA